MAIFFFSSRRRHTRCLSDWSSDVCSSDLPDRGAGFLRVVARLKPAVSLSAAKVNLDAIGARLRQDRKSTRLNSSHLGISYAVFCLKKKKKKKKKHKKNNIIYNVHETVHCK